MRKVLLLLTLAAGVAFSQTATYPSAVVTDNQLRVAVNNTQTTLSFPMLSSDTTINVVNAAGIVASSTVTIDNEKIAVCSVSGNQLTVGKSACPNVDGRGFDSTAAAAHANGAGVTLNIDAWHHNAVKAEVEAIESFLGVNGANVQVPNPLPVNKGGSGAATETGILQGNGTGAFTGIPAGSGLQYLRVKATGTNGFEFAGLPLFSVPDFNWPAQTPGGTLTATVGASVTLTPCPLGVAGANTSLKFYVSGGVGAAEPVTLTGGTCTSGAASGTVQFTPANSHSGAWTIQSASAGLLEAYYANPWTTLFLPKGNYLMRACLTFPISTTGMFGLQGVGWMDGSTFANPGNSTGSVLNFSNVSCGTSGAMNISLPSIGTGEVLLRNLYIVGGGQGTGNGVVSTNLARLFLDHVQVANFGTTGVLLTDAIDGSIFHSEISSNGAYGVAISGTGNRIDIVDSDITGNSRGDNAANISIAGTSGTRNSVVTLMGNTIESAGASPYGAPVTNTGGVYVNWTDTLNMTGNHLESNNQYAVTIDAGTRMWNAHGNWFGTTNAVKILVSNDVKSDANTFSGAGADYQLPAGVDLTGFSLGQDFYIDGATNSRGVTAFGNARLQALVPLSGKTASIGQTSILCGGQTCPAGIYLANVIVETTTAASGGAGCTVTADILYTDRAGAVTTAHQINAFSLAALGRTSVVVPIDSNAANIAYSTTVAAGTCTGTPTYALTIMLQRLQ